MAISTNKGLVNGPVHNLLMQFFTPGSSKIEVFELCFFDIVTTQNDHPRYVKHVLGRVYMFSSPYLGIGRMGGGSPKRLVHNLLMQFSTLGSSKIEVFEICFNDIVATQNDHPRYVKHVLGHIYIFFTIFWVLGPGVGGVPRDGYTTCLCSFSPWPAQKSKFLKVIFMILWPPKMTIQGM